MGAAGLLRTWRRMRDCFPRGLFPGLPEEFAKTLVMDSIDAVEGFPV